MNHTTTRSQDSIPLVIAVMTTFIIVGLLEKMILHSTNGVFMYPLDDPFIHMQVAKNLAFHQAWGINAHEFGSASSSILYTLLLGGLFKIFGVNVMIPFLVNCIAGLLLLYVAHQWLLKQLVKTWGRIIILLMLVVFIPLPVMIISGMEHTLQCLFSFLFLTEFSTWLGKNREAGDQGKWKLPLSVLIYGVLMVMVRYEGGFFIIIACLLLLWYKKIGSALQLGIISVLPVIIFGIYSVSKGSYFLPNSVLVKSGDMTSHGMMQLLNNILVNKLTIVKPVPGASPATPPPGISLLATQRLLIILPLIYMFFFEPIRKNRSYVYLFIMAMLTTLLHLCLASTGWFYRYEAYLIFPAIMIVCVVIYKYGRYALEGKWKYAGLAVAVLLFALFFPFLLRSAAGYSNTKQACINIYEQQYQMGQFVKKYLPNDAIAVNDIGAVSYYSDSKVTDLWGLGSFDIAKSKREKYWTPAFLDSFVNKQKVKLAIVYDKWFDPDLLQRWTKIGSWRIYNNVICGDDSVSFYSIHQEDIPALRKNLGDYEPVLPKGVKVTYYQ